MYNKSSSVAGGHLSPLGTALLEWFNVLPLFQSGREIRVDDLSNGESIWEVLKQLEPYHFRDELPEASSRGSGRWLRNWQNLKHIYKHLANYITTHNGKLPTGPGAVDLQTIAKGDEDSEELIKVDLRKATTNQTETDYTTQLLEMVMFVVVRSTENEAFIRPMTLLSEENQALIHNLIIKVSPATEPMVISSSNEAQLNEPPESEAIDGPAPVSAAVDKDLFYEQQIAYFNKDNSRLVREIKLLQKDFRDQNDRNGRLQTHNANLQEKLAAAEAKLEQSSGAVVGESFLKEFGTTVSGQQSLIEQQEQQLADLQKRNDTLRSENSQFRASHEKLQPLQDQVDELKSERDALHRSNNAMEKLKQKLEVLVDVKKENSELRDSLDEARQLLREGNTAKERNRLLQKQLDENNEVLPRIEGELFEAQLMKKCAQEDADQIRHNLEQINTQYEKAQNRIQELAEQLQSSGGSTEGMSSLEAELAGNKTRETELVSKNLIMWTRLTYASRHADTRKQRDQLDKSLSEATTRVEALERMLDLARSRNSSLEKHISNYISKSPEDHFKGLPVFFPLEEELTNEGPSDDAKKADEAAELEREKAAFQRKLTDIKSVVQDGKLILHELLEKAADENQVSLVDKQELDRLKGLDGLTGDFRLKNEETKWLQEHVVKLEAQLKEYQSMLRAAAGGSNVSDEEAAEYLKVVQAVDKPGVKLLTEKDRAEVDSFTAGLLNELARHRQTMMEHEQVQERLSLTTIPLGPHIPQPTSPAGSADPISLSNTSPTAKRKTFLSLFKKDFS